MSKFKCTEVFSVNNPKNLPKENNKSTAINRIHVDNIEFNNLFNWGVDRYSYKIDNCVFNWDINLIRWSFTFKNCHFTSSITSMKFWWNISFEECIFDIDFIEKRNINFETIMFTNCKCKKIELKYLWTTGIYFHDTKFSSLNIDKVKVIKDEELKFHIAINSTKKSWNIIIDGVEELENLHIWDTRRKGNFWKVEIRNINFLSWDNNSYIINDSKIDKLDLRYCTNYSNKLVFQNLRLKNLYTKNTDLWKTTLNWVSIDEIYFENVTFNDCIFNGVDFPLNYTLIEWNLSNKQLRDTYRQLKHVMDKNANHIEANNFFEKEMEYEMLRLWVSKWIWAGFLSLFQEKFIGGKAQDKWKQIQLWFGWQCNEFWNNWMRAILWILILAFSTTLINLLYNYGIYIEWYWGRGLPFSHFIDNYKQYIKLFMNLLYPLYWVKKDFIDWLDNWLTFWFYLYKIIYSILFWHLIIAVKRVTRR